MKAASLLHRHAPRRILLHEPVDRQNEAGENGDNRDDHDHLDQGKRSGAGGRIISYFSAIRDICEWG